MSEFQPETRLPVVVQDEQPAIPPEKARAAPAGPKWEAEARERIKAGIRRFAKPLSDLLERDANEGDTRMVVNRILTDVFGFDEFSDLTTEYSVKGEFADYGIRIDRDLVAFIEVKGSRRSSPRSISGKRRCTPLTRAWNGSSSRMPPSGAPTT